MTTPNPLDLLRAAIRCDMAYMEPTWAARSAQCRVDVEDGVQYLSIAGTNDGKDVLHDVSVFWVVRDILGTVRKGFAEAWDPLRDAGAEAIGLRRDLPVVFNCHSLGVPVGQYTNALLLQQGYEVHGGVGFGAPAGWDKDGSKIPPTPWCLVKKGYDPVADRPWLLYRGTAGGKWWQIDDGKIREGRRHPLVKSWRPWRDGNDHKLQGPDGYIVACAKLVGNDDWRSTPWGQDWARARAAFDDRGKVPMVVGARP